MNNDKILYKVLKKARENNPDLISEGVLDCTVENREYYKIIFDPEFAKAFWGNESVWNDNGEPSAYPSREGQNLKCIYNWQYQLQQMVLEKEPLKYLELFLDE